MSEAPETARASEELRKLYPGARPAGEEVRPPKREKLVDGKVIRRKKPMGDRIVEFLTGPEAREVVRDWTVQVVGNIVRDTAWDIVETMRESAQEALFGPRVAPRRRRYGRGGPYPYDRAPSSRSTLWEADHRGGPRRRHPHSFEDVILPTRSEAERIIDELYKVLSARDYVLVSDLNDMLGEPSPYTDQNYGWTDLHGTHAIPVRDGYLIDIPRPILIDYNER
jgi:hypothetical protein